MRRWHLNETNPAKVRDSFDASYALLASEVTSQSRKLPRPLNSNTIILDYLDTSQSMMSYERESRWVELFSELSPGRIFFFVQGEGERQVLLPDERELGDSLVSGGVAIGSDDGRARYSDVVFGRLRDYEPKALLSLFRSQLQVGFRPRLVLLGSPSENGAVEGLIEDASSVIFSSRYRNSAPAVFEKLFSSSVELIDLEWLQGSSWRAQLRNLALKYDLSDSYERLHKVSVYSSALVDDAVGVQEGIDASSALFLGWLVSQMKSRVSSLSQEGIECITQTGRRWFISHERDKEPAPVSLREVQLHFENVSRAKDKNHSSKSETEEPKNGPIQDVRIHLNENQMYETHLQCGERKFHFTGSTREFTPEDDLRRYFIRGESISSYRRAYSNAVEIQELFGCSTQGVFS